MRRDFIVKLLSMRRLLALVALLLLPAGCEQPRPTFDVIIRNGSVYDGFAEAAQSVDVAVVGDRIAAVGTLDGARAALEVDATGLAVAPGFIDVQGRSGTTLLADGTGESHLRQGITSEIIGDVDSPAFWTKDTADVATLRAFSIAFDWTGADGYFERLLHRGVTLNVGTLVPVALAPWTDTAIDQAMRDGALGIAISRDVPSESAPLNELMALARVTATRGGVVTIQLPDRAAAAVQVVDSAIRIGREANVPIVLYPPDNFESLPIAELLAKIRTARAAGATIHATMNPYGVDGDLASWLRLSGASIGSQSPALGAVGLLSRSAAHPRAYGTFPRVLAKYVREDNVLTLGEAIRRMTSTAAAQFRLEGRGAIRVGNVADLVVFDPVQVRDHATLERPHQPSTGIHHVIINGVRVLDPTGLTGARPGRALFGRGRGPQGPPA
jgi:N-acyl-D-amino-acid deacylase